MYDDAPGSTKLLCGEGRLRLINDFPESLIIKIWQHQLLDRTDLATEEGEPIRIV
jgi:hypothetical protein